MRMVDGCGKDVSSIYLFMYENTNLRLKFWSAGCKMASLTLDKFECNGDVSSVRTRWESWKRSLHIYLEAANVQTASQKRASLLHWGGPELQEIYYNLPEIDKQQTESEDGVVDVFKIALEKLDAYFAPKQSKRFERHIFRKMKQQEDEKLEKYVLRLRRHAQKCQFKDTEDQILDQITEACNSEELRKKILKSGDSMTLEDVITEGNALEIVSRQLEEFNHKPTFQNVNKIDSKLNEKQPTKKECFRCGSWKHLAFSETCPARGKTCLKCGARGHFKLKCKSNPLKKKLDIDNFNKVNTDFNKKFKKPRSQVRNIEEEDNENTPDINYVFNINDNEMVSCVIGGVQVQMLIDSGCKHNLLTDKTWKMMKLAKVKVTEQNGKPNKTFLAYGSTVPLKLIGSFRSEISIAGNTEDTTFYVVDGGTRNLLGKTTSLALGVLKIGLGVSNVGEEPQQMPKVKDVLVHIPIDDTVKPVAQPYRRIPIPLEEKVEKKVTELLQKDIIEKVEGPSDWISPVVPILKENGEIRLCIDMRRANVAIKRENHPLPTMDQLLPKIKDANVFSKLDIKDAFHQLELHPDSRHITTFITSKGLYRYKRLMFGITCAPEIFQKTLERVLLNCKGVINFIDDILVFGKDEKEHNERLQSVLTVLNDNGIVLRHDKCLYNVSQIQFLGHELSKQGIKPLDKYLAAINQFRPPKTISELLSFLGLINYVGKWIPNMATITEPLKLLLRHKFGRNTNITELWGQDQEKAFTELKSALSKIPRLGFYDVMDKTIVFADASPVALGAVLVQINNEGPRIIAFGNKTLTECERRYCQTEKEALALVWGVEHFHLFLYGKKFDLVTDHKPLEVIFGPKSKPCARIERWIMRLQSYDYRVIYRPGKNNIADPLSRLCELTPEYGKRDYVQDIVELTRPVAVTLKEISHHSRNDPDIQKVKKGIYENVWDDSVKGYKLFETELCFSEDILLRGGRIVIPKALRSRVLAAAHEGHPGVVAMKGRLRSKVWWPRYDKDAENMVKCCKGCTLVSAPNPPHPLKRRELPEYPWIDIAIDLLGPLPSGEYILVVIDYYSRYKEIKICRDISSKEMIRLLREIFSRLGYPVTLITDNGKQFISTEFKTFCLENDIKLHHSIPYWPQQNGEVERQNRDILKRLRICQAEKKCHWKDSLLDYLVMYNSTPHSVTGKTPAELFFQRKFRDKIPMIDTLNYTPSDIDVRDKDKQEKEKGKEYSDKKRRAHISDYDTGDKVYIKNMNRANKLCTPFEPVKHTVKACKGGDVEIENDETGQVLRRNVVHLKKVEGEWRVIGETETEKEE